MGRMRITRLCRQTSIPSLPLIIMEKSILWKYLTMSIDNCFYLCFYSVIVYLFKCFVRIFIYLAFIKKKVRYFCIPRASCKNSILKECKMLCDPFCSDEIF